MAGEMIGVRSTVISQVLGTDMKKHFDILSRYQVRNVHMPSSCCLIQVLSLQHTVQLLKHLTFSCFPAFRDLVTCMFTGRACKNSAQAMTDSQHNE